MSLELWGGIEATINRIGNSYTNQLEKSGHIHRIGDLEKFASLGIKKLRYPVLWEMCDKNLDWAEERLNKLRDLDIEPIVGLLHHGSGPHYTSLSDPLFPHLLADYADEVARRFPWVKYYTPVNEPLTTARFSGLYGVWYPHTRDNAVFGQCLLNECKATIKAMERIHQVNPDAVLIQTEDLGKTYSVPELQYQADYENERRWATFDLICGNIKDNSVMYEYLHGLGFKDEDFLFFTDNICDKTILGVDSYLTSTRFLDTRLEHYPKELHGGNGQHAYVDIECLKVMKKGMPPINLLLMEAWQRYRKPIAITEAHVNGNDPERIKWFIDFWNGAQEARKLGADIRAVTSWGLLGLYDWNTLVTKPGIYEAGAFSVENGEVHETELAKVLRDIAAGRNIMEEHMCYQAWWSNDHERLTYPAYECPW